MRVLFSLLILASLLLPGRVWATGTYLDFEEFTVTTGSVPADSPNWRYSSRATNDTGVGESAGSGWYSRTNPGDGFNWFFDFARIDACNTHYYFDTYSFMDIVGYGHTGKALRTYITGGRNTSCVNLGTPVRNKETFDPSHIYTGDQLTGSMYLYFKKVNPVGGNSRDFSPYLLARDANRLTFYVKFPADMNIGAADFARQSWFVGVHREPDTTSSDTTKTNRHHYMNGSINGGGWTRVQIDETTNGDNSGAADGKNARHIPDLLKTTWQWYIAATPYTGNAKVPYEVLVDEIRWEHDSYAPQNNQTISNIAVMYKDATKTWEMSFNDRYKNAYAYSTYEVRYSFSPITNENWSQATPVQTLRDVARHIYERADGKFQKFKPDVAYVWVPFKMLDADTEQLIPGRMVYFAVKDISQAVVMVDGVPQHIGRTGAQPLLTEYPYNIGTDRGGRNFDAYPAYLFDAEGTIANLPYIKRTYYQIAPGNGDYVPPADSDPPAPSTLRLRGNMRGSVR